MTWMLLAVLILLCAGVLAWKMQTRTAPDAITVLLGGIHVGITELVAAEKARHAALASTLRQGPPPAPPVTVSCEEADGTLSDHTVYAAKLPVSVLRDVEGHRRAYTKSYTKGGRWVYRYVYSNPLPKES